MMNTKIELVRKRRRVAGAVALGVVGVGLVAGALIVGLTPDRDAPPPGSPAAAAGMDHAGVERVLEAARHQLNQREHEKAAILLREAIARAPEVQELRTLYAQTLLSMGDARAAHAEYEAAIAIGPDDAELRFAAGTVANAAGLTRQALEHYWMAQTQDPSNPKHPLYLAQIQRKLGEIDEAKASLLRVVKLDPQVSIAWGVLADIALQENRLSVARNHIARAREAEPQSVRWRMLEARIERRDNQPEQALRLLLALGDAELLADPLLLEEVAMNYALLGRPDDAAALYARSVEQAPGDAELTYQAALWSQRAGRHDAARGFAQRAASLGSEPARSMLARMDQQD